MHWGATTQNVTLTDQVVVTKAAYNSDTGTLVVVAFAVPAGLAHGDLPNPLNDLLALGTGHPGLARIGRFLAGHGRRLVGWDEILQGDMPASAAITSSIG